jgi:hypothetical protein
MRTERAVLLALLLAAPAVRAQIPVDPLTEVRAIRFSGEHALSERKLRALLQTKDRGPAYGLRVALGKIPGVPSPAHHPFSPLVLQQDVVRLRQAYAAAGYFLAHVRYDVHRDEARNLLDITFVCEEGRPLLLADVSVTGADSTTALEVPVHDRKSWNRLVRNLLRQRGKPLAIEVATDGRDRLRAGGAIAVTRWRSPPFTRTPTPRARSRASPTAWCRGRSRALATSTWRARARSPPARCADSRPSIPGTPTRRRRSSARGSL